MRKILAQIKLQTVVGWTVVWGAAVLVNAVLLIRMATDFLYAYHDAGESG